MKATICDICGKKITRLDRHYEFNKPLKGWFYTLNEISRVDICLDCAREIRNRVMERRKKEKND